MPPTPGAWPALLPHCTRPLLQSPATFVAARAVASGAFRIIIMQCHDAHSVGRLCPVNFFALISSLFLKLLVGVAVRQPLEAPVRYEQRGSGGNRLRWQKRYIRQHIIIRTPWQHYY